MAWSKPTSNAIKPFFLITLLAEGRRDINDSKEDAHELARLLKGIPCKINLIPYNETDGQYQCPNEEKITRFSEILHSKRDKYRVLVRWSKGQDIAAGCGQLVGQEA